MIDSGPPTAELGIIIEPQTTTTKLKPSTVASEPQAQLPEQGTIVAPEIDIPKNAEVDQKLLDIRNKLYDVLAQYKATAESMPNVFGYGRQNFQNFDQISIFVLDDKALRELSAIAGEIFYAQEFLQNPSTKGIFLAGFDAVLVKRVGEEQEGSRDKSVRQISEEAAIIHELAHASAENIIMKKVDPAKNGGVEYKPTRIGLETSTSDSVKGTEDWTGMFIEEGFAQDHYGRYIATHYPDQQKAALLDFLGQGHTYEDGDGHTKFVIYQKVGDERRRLVIDPDLVFLDGKRLMITPPSYAAATYRDLCQTIPNFRDTVEQARKDPNGFDSFWSKIQQTHREFYEKFYNGRYVDPFNSNNSFKTIAFDYYDSVHRAEEVPTTKVLYIN